MISYIKRLWTIASNPSYVYVPHAETYRLYELPWYKSVFHKTYPSPREFFAEAIWIEAARQLKARQEGKSK